MTGLFTRPSSRQFRLHGSGFSPCCVARFPRSRSLHCWRIPSVWRHFRRLCRAAIAVLRMPSATSRGSYSDFPRSVCSYKCFGQVKRQQPSPDPERSPLSDVAASPKVLRTGNSDLKKEWLPTHPWTSFQSAEVGSFRIVFPMLTPRTCLRSSDGCARRVQNIASKA